MYIEYLKPCLAGSSVLYHDDSIRDDGDGGDIDIDDDVYLYTLFYS